MVKIKLSHQSHAKLSDMVLKHRALNGNPARIIALIERFYTVSAHHPEQPHLSGPS
jgi:hypothetical protein